MTKYEEEDDVLVETIPEDTDFVEEHSDPIDSESVLQQEDF